MSKEIIPLPQIARTIRIVRRQKVLLDVDLARLYGVTTGNLNKAVQRNAGCLAADFAFQLTAKEAENLRFQFGISSWGGRRAFLNLRQTLETNRELARKFKELEGRVGGHDQEIAGIIEAIRQLIEEPETPKRQIGFHAREAAPPYQTRKRR